MDLAQIIPHQIADCDKRLIYSIFIALNHPQLYLPMHYILINVRDSFADLEKIKMNVA
jgi:hypothetical protein